MKTNFFSIDCRWHYIFAMTWLSSFGCSCQDEFKKELPPVSKDVRFTPSETLKVTPIGVQKQ